jgi:hypothetical protein
VGPPAYLGRSINVSTERLAANDLDGAQWWLAQIERELIIAARAHRADPRAYLREPLAALTWRKPACRPSLMP